MLAKMRNIGEACTAANRFLVHESLAREFASRLAERMGALTIGRGVEDGVQVGPLIDTSAVEKVSRAGRRRRGCRGRGADWGSAIEGPGYFYLLRCWAASRRAPGSTARRFSDRSRRSFPSTPMTRASRWPTTPSSAWLPTPSPRV